MNPGDGSVLAGFAADFCAASLKFRDYYYNWNSGHRYVLNLREDESYTRYYAPLGSSSDYWVGSESVSAPDPAQTFENDAVAPVRHARQWTLDVHAQSDTGRMGACSVPVYEHHGRCRGRPPPRRRRRRQPR